VYIKFANYIIGYDIAQNTAAKFERPDAPILGADYQIGKTITFGGHFWRVLDVQGNHALLLLENILEQRSFHSALTNVTWETSDIRQYLNGEFFNSFSEANRARIRDTWVINNNNVWYGTNSGNNTNDRIFLLSIEEVVQYFGDSGQLHNRPDSTSLINDQYNYDRKPRNVRRDDDSVGLWWWLRSNGSNSERAASVDGYIVVYGRSVGDDAGGVRPALWLNLETESIPDDAPFFNLEVVQINGRMHLRWEEVTVNGITFIMTHSLESGWAREGIVSAIAKGFVPGELQNNYTDIITRAEFCRMAVMFAEYATGKSIDDILAENNVSRNQYAFTDTNDQYVLAAYALGITGGTGNNQFTPNGHLTREQAAVMIRNVCRVIGMNTDNPPPSGFADMASASSWSADGINFVRAAGIMSGTGDNNFSPGETYSREQSIVTFNNILER
jgi:hypothetical protein